jgi:putative hemolysin
MNQRKIIESIHSIFPVAEGSLDNVLGVVLAKDLLVATLEGRPVDLGENLREPLYVPDNMPALKAWSCSEGEPSNGLVIDEHGGVRGLVTLNDILEVIVGEVNVRGEEEPEIVEERMAPGFWMVLPVDEFAELFDLDDHPDRNCSIPDIGRFVMTHLGRILPLELRMGRTAHRVVDMDGFRG